MISSTFQCLLIAAMVINIFFTIRQIRKSELKIKYSLLWLFAGFAMLLLSIFPQLILKLSHIMGIADDVNTLFFLLILFIYIILFSYSIILSRASQRDIRLAQEIAILRHDVDQLKKLQGQTIHKKR